MTYKEALELSMTRLAEDEKVLFVGYNTKFGRAAGTLANVQESQLIEMPVAENLMVGMATGLSLKGFKPVVYFERFDFVLNGLDAIVNHLDKIEILSKHQFCPKIIIRVVIGGQKYPLFTGLTHTQDFTQAVRRLVGFPVIRLESTADVLEYYGRAVEWDSSMMFIELKDLYNE